MLKGIRDPAFLGAAGGSAAWTPDPATLWAWWKADEYVTTGSNNAITVWGDASTNTVNKTALTGTRNLLPLGTYKSVLSTSNGAANIHFLSEEMLNAAWTTFNCTKNTDTTCTFTGTGGVINTYYPIYRTGVTYTLKVQLRNISGNTGLRLVTFGSPTGNYTPITITSSLAQYSHNFLGNGGSIYVGVDDPNGAGWGQIEATQWQVYEANWGSCPYVHNPTTDTMLYPTFGGLRCCCLGSRALSNAWMYYGNASYTDSGSVYPVTVYMAVYMSTDQNATTPFFTAQQGPGAINADLNPTDFSIFSNSNPAQRVDTSSAFNAEAFNIFTGVWNAGSSSIRHNKGTAVTGTTATPASNLNGYWVGGEGVNPNALHGALYEVIVRDGADNTATQDLFIDYLASRVGISV